MGQVREGRERSGGLLHLEVILGFLSYAMRGFPTLTPEGEKEAPSIADSVIYKLPPFTTLKCPAHKNQLANLDTIHST